MNQPSPLMMWGPSFLGILFFFAFGATVGSFLNVVAYRLPKGLDIVRPPSACPACGTKLTWRENVPIVGWIMLRGRCRFCKSPISPEYPLVEFVVAVLFGGLFALWYLDAGLVRSLGVTPSEIRPDWTTAGFARTWPMFVLILTLIGGLVAMTLIDAKTYLIPLSIPWLVAGVAIVVHPVFALWASTRQRPVMRGEFDWTIWTFDDWSMTGAALGASVGIGVALILLRAGLLPRSFADYETWEREAEAAAKKAETASTESETPTAAESIGPALVRTMLFTGPAIALMAVGFSIGIQIGSPLRGMFFGMAVGLLVGLVLRRFGPDDAANSDDPIWVQYPHARREMLWELLFLAPLMILSVVGYMIAARIGAEPPLWIKALTGSLIGLLVGGGVVWAIRIFGTLAFGKEAMGLGDVHLMAAVGAVLGWVDPVIAFFVAPFFGIIWTLGAAFASRFRRGSGSALPYGPHLAAATILIIFAKPLVAWGLTLVMGRTVLLP